MKRIVISGEELEALCGLPHIQQLTYLRGIRPYMDLGTGVTGIKRRVSYQSISEQLYIEPHQGIKSQSFSRDQVRRAVAGLAKAGLVEVQSEGKQLILKCLLVKGHYSVQNKAAINPPQEATTTKRQRSLVNTETFEGEALKATTAKAPKAATPHKENNYIYLLRDFEKFWLLYPEKKSREQALDVFQQINPNQELLEKILAALNQQIQAQSLKSASGQWVPAWKYPANWLSQKCWEDEVTTEGLQEKGNAKCRRNTKHETVDPFWEQDFEEPECGEESAFESSNVISLQRYR